MQELIRTQGGPARPPDMGEKLKKACPVLSQPTPGRCCRSPRPAQIAWIGDLEGTFQIDATHRATVHKMSKKMKYSPNKPFQ